MTVMALIDDTWIWVPGMIFILGVNENSGTFQIYRRENKIKTLLHDSVRPAKPSYLTLVRQGRTYVFYLNQETLLRYKLRGANKGYYLECDRYFKNRSSLRTHNYRYHDSISSAKQAPLEPTD